MILQPHLFTDVIDNVVGRTDIKDIQVKGNITKLLDLLLKTLS
jgi:hypothetical protein